MRTARSTTSRKRPWTRLLTALTGLVGVAVLGGLGPASAQAQEETALATGLHISDGRLVEGNGNDFIMRGVNHAHTWYPNETQSLADVKALGSNTVRVVLSNGHRWSENSPSDVASVIEDCKANRLICVLEVHDTTGYGEEPEAGTLDGAADYWIGLKDVLDGEEDYIIINIGNEPWGNTNPAGWTAPTIAAIQKLRDAGFAHTIMIDAPNWGQDWEGVMRATAQSVYEADPTGNLVFSIHMYSVYDTAEKITDYLESFVRAGLPLVIGEFGGPPDEWGDPDEDAMLAAAEQYRLGYLAWSWSGNTDPILDLAIGFDPSRLSSWGERIFHGVNGIAETSKEATVFGDDGGSGPQPGAGCAVGYRVVGEWGDGFQGEIVIRNTGTSAINGWSLAFAFPSGQTVTSMWGGSVTQSGGSVTVTPAAYTATIPAGGSVSVGFLGSKGSANNAPTGFTLGGSACASV